MDEEDNLWFILTSINAIDHILCLCKCDRPLRCIDPLVLLGTKPQTNLGTSRSRKHFTPPSPTHAARDDAAWWQTIQLTGLARALPVPALASVSQAPPASSAVIRPDADPVKKKKKLPATCLMKSFACSAGEGCLLCKMNTGGEGGGNHPVSHYPVSRYIIFIQEDHPSWKVITTGHVCVPAFGLGLWIICV